MDSSVNKFSITKSNSLKNALLEQYTELSEAIEQTDGTQKSLTDNDCRLIKKRNKKQILATTYR